MKNRRKNSGLITALVLIMSLFTWGCREKTDRMKKICKNKYATNGERAGCMLGVYSAKNKLKKSCNLITGCALKTNYPRCNSIIIRKIISELSERNFRSDYIKFTDELLGNIDSVTTTHPILIVNACRQGKNFYNKVHGKDLEKSEKKVEPTSIVLELH
ncbi:MAG: hypothetical protein PF689_11965 [Deltaproteobacteria bacterium]|jgi:hypothetical protein|nr:hypothetical protein [Deltaproteobacteria bacterium]